MRASIPEGQRMDILQELYSITEKEEQRKWIRRSLIEMEKNDRSEMQWWRTSAQISGSVCFSRLLCHRRRQLHLLTSRPSQRSSSHENSWTTKILARHQSNPCKGLKPHPKLSVIKNRSPHTRSRKSLAAVRRKARIWLTKDHHRFEAIPTAQKNTEEEITPFFLQTLTANPCSSRLDDPHLRETIYTADIQCNKMFEAIPKPCALAPALNPNWKPYYKHHHKDTINTTDTPCNSDGNNN